MQDFNIYFSIGIGHILTLEAGDHILFIAALCLRYLIKDWKNVVVLVTAFTIGHSITLALSAVGWLHVSSRWIEFLIPTTIVITAANNLMQRPSRIDHPSRMPAIYFFALFFGLIHGMAFANSLLSLMGKNDILIPLISFNLGIETAQLLIVAMILAVSFILVQVFRLRRTWWVRGASVVILILSVRMAFQRWPAHLTDQLTQHKTKN